MENNIDSIPKKSNWRTTQQLELVHVDIYGPITLTSNSNKKYILLFIDDYSRKSWVYSFKCLKNKVETEAEMSI
ncbi:hypothetical protein VIGAN_08326300 [Vigna angularis var. angularis]|uniref:Integrase catalytic domain-containing protein n=1 Tax=Vigna angularis var. angularis TaxID=157739 RepID=A0A0S3SU35_PHAAN|nr:hypothetical protein VIGAN_08326300 [Vigna angularis var. angularis]